jgi:arylsulfatase A-like enzyme
MVLTVTNHVPFQLPEDASGRYPIPAALRNEVLEHVRTNRAAAHYTLPMLDTIHYTDEAVGDFFAAARTRSWFPSTLFVIASDHGLPISPPDGVPGLHELAELRHRVPVVVLAPWVPGGSVITDPASLADLPATILGLCGLQVPRCGPGIDILDPALAAAPRPVIAWNDEARLLTVASAHWVYHASVGDLQEGHRALRDELLVPAGGSSDSGDWQVDRGQALERHRRWAQVYLGVYPWLVTSGRAVVPGR